MQWMWLAIAILFEVAGTFCLKLSNGLTKLTPSLLTFVFYFICFSALALALKKIEVSIAYAIWSGLGTVLICSLGVIYFDESLSFLKIISIALIILGVMGLHLSLN